MEAVKVYRSDMNRQEKPSKCVKTERGYEVLTNNGKMKIVLTRHRYFRENLSDSCYISTYYVKEGNGWLKTNTHNTHSTIEEFFRALNQTEDFTQAMEDYKQYK